VVSRLGNEDSAVHGSDVSGVLIQAHPQGWNMLFQVEYCREIPPCVLTALCMPTAHEVKDHL